MQKTIKCWNPCTYILIYQFFIKIVKASYIDSTNISARVARLNPSWNGDNSEETYYVNIWLYIKFIISSIYVLFSTNIYSFISFFIIYYISFHLKRNNSWKVLKYVFHFLRWFIK